MKAGLLPLYIELYDNIVPQIRPGLEAFYNKLADMIEAEGIGVVRVPFCRLKSEFENAIEKFELENADAIITVHMAYSPSLESIDALCKTDLPVIVLDTTRTLTFDNRQNPEEIMYCHGIHGVMDMCSMLTRRGKPYAIAAGHCEKSDAVKRVCGFVRSAVCARALKNMHVGLIGGAFEGMGDFRVSYEELYSRFGIKTEQMNAEIMAEIYDSLTPEEIENEKETDRRDFVLGESIIESEYDLSVRSRLALRKYVKETGLNAYSVNFKAVRRDLCGLTSMPFAECCKAMADGVGYAGEGDAMTAAFTGSFLKAYPESSFVEIFCPDWENDLLFLSHMGEMNYKLASHKPVMERAATNYSPGAYPYAAYTSMKSAKGVYVNISRAKDDYRLTYSPAELIGFDEDNFEGSMRGWMKPAKSTTAEFLEGLSRCGATHHSVFVTGASTEEIAYYAKLLGIVSEEV